MILSESLTIGQITFVLRVAVQILSYGGLALINLLILGNAPRVALIETHDVINRVVGKSSTTSSSAKWILNRLRSSRKDPISSTNFLIALFLSLSYTAFVALSDIGYLGFHACSIPEPTILDFPASVSSDDAARALVAANMVNGTDPSTIKAYRCNTVEPINFGNFTLNGCTAWRNSTYADTTWFDGINSTDTDILMPRQFSQHTNPASDAPPLNSYHYGPTTQRLIKPTIVRGLAIDPHETGLRVVIGVPQLTQQQKVELPKVMALEVDVGCMTLGIYSQHNIDTLGTGLDIFATTSNWRKYTGPDYLRDVLANTTDTIRQFYRPFFNESSLDSGGFLYGVNDTSSPLSGAANIARFTLPGSNINAADYITGNCTRNLQSQLGIPTPTSRQGKMCGFLAMGGSFSLEGQRYQTLSRMVCATATQLNMVDATIVVDAENNMSLNLTRLPSDLNHLRADYWDTQKDGNDTRYVTFDSYDRFTLADNPASPTTHFITHYEMLLTDNTLGPGAGGDALNLIGDMMLASPPELDNAAYAGLALLDEGFEDVNIANTSTVRTTQWSGQLGASFILGSVGYNGWAARASSRVPVLSTGGKIGSCYKPQYGFGFVPLVFSAMGVVIWAIVMLVRKSLSGAKSLELAYGGLRPYVDVICPGAPVEDTVLVWEKAPELHLQVVSKGDVVLGSENGSGTALRDFKAGYEYPLVA
jgi:hypothetical protein